ncbi:LysM domain [Actinomyces bovis]|uniref:LysM domain n=1 Tax=Actinomyces bovis TaxID=1658 RepID=A0ABY1VP58_9ACTO|nr:LysM peptidoglycan-binding domain-containing protein [Actinomyces bovis]SPT53914.1 LysM domain [Actinomyces bovis]VEG53391.1 LysM domain [Actinomyces israelii]
MSAMVIPVQASREEAAASVAAAPIRAKRVRPSHLRLVTPDFVPESAPRPALVSATVSLPAALKPAVPAARRVRAEQNLIAAAKVPQRPAREVKARVGVASKQGDAVAAVPAQEVSKLGFLAALPGWLRVLVAGALVTVAIVATACAGAITAAIIAEPVQTTTAVVQSGQSLWDVAAATGAADVPEAVAQIRELNGLRDSVLQPGQRLLVPVG